MKKLVWLIFILPIVGFAQPGFIKAYDSFSEQYGSEFEDVLIDNDTIVLYSLSFDENHKQGIRFTKLDTFGNILSEKIYVDTPTLTTAFFRKKIIKTQDGGYAMMGTVNGVIGIPFLLKVHHDLSLDFLKKYPSNIGSGNGSLLEVDGGYMLVGRESNGGPGDIFVIKTDKQGEFLWRKKYGKGSKEEGAINISKLDDNFFVITGGRSDFVSGGQSTWTTSLIIAIDSVGQEKWEWESFQDLDQSAIWDFEILPDSSWICISGTWEWGLFGSYETRPMVFRMDKDFNLMWQWIYWRMSPIQFFTDLERTPDGNFIASGWMRDDSSMKGVHYKFSPMGDSLWMRRDSVFPESTNPGGTRVTGTDLLSSGSIISVGYAYKSGSQGTYGFVMKMSADGCIDTLNCHPVASYEPLVEVAKISVYPNPVDEELTVNLNDYQPKEAAIYFYDLLGRFLRKERVHIGRNMLSVSDLPTGLIFYEVRDSGVLMTLGKLVKMNEN